MHTFFSLLPVFRGESFRNNKEAKRLDKTRQGKRSVKSANIQKSKHMQSSSLPLFLMALGVSARSQFCDMIFRGSPAAAAYAYDFDLETQRHVAGACKFIDAMPLRRSANTSKLNR